MSYRGWTHLDLGVRLQTEPLGNGAAAYFSTFPCLHALKACQYSPVLASGLSKDALCAESLLGRLQMSETSQVSIYGLHSTTDGQDPQDARTYHRS